MLNRKLFHKHTVADSNGEVPVLTSLSITRRALAPVSYLLLHILATVALAQTAAAADGGNPSWRKLPDNQIQEVMDRVTAAWNADIAELGAVEVTVETQFTVNGTPAAPPRTVRCFRDAASEHYYRFENEDVGASNPAYSFEVGQEGEGWILKQLSKTQASVKNVTVARLGSDLGPRGPNGVYGFYVRALPGLQTAVSFFLPRLLGHHGCKVVAVHEQRDGDRLRLDLTQTAPVDRSDGATLFRSGTIVLDPAVDWKVVECTSVVDFSDGIADCKTHFDYATFAGRKYAHRITETRPLRKPSSENVVVVRETTFEPLAESGFDTSQCYLTAYGLPEPEFDERSPWRTVSILAVGIALVVGGFLLIKRQFSH